MEKLIASKRSNSCKGEVITDHYGRKLPKCAHSTGDLGNYTSSARRMLQTVSGIYDRIVDEKLLIWQLNIVTNHVIDETSVAAQPDVKQLDLFTC